jgi:hypothetical protein
MKRAVAVTVAVVLVLVFWLGVPARGDSRAAVQSGGGRFQIVNGTPEMTRNIMLLDSTSGESWIVCTDEGGTSGWCQMTRFKEGSHVVPKTSP